MLRPDEKQRLADRWTSDAILTSGVWRWRTNGSVPPGDVMDAAEEMGCATALEVAACAVARAEELRAFIAAYKARQPRTPSAEEQMEMRAAFGRGTEVIDVLSGRRWTT